METFETPFPHGFIMGDYGVGSVPKIVDEMDIIKLSISIREKPNWSEKMNDPIIVSKWRAEIADSITQSDKKFDYVLAELGNDFSNSFSEFNSLKSLIMQLWQDIICQTRIVLLKWPLWTTHGNRTR